MKVSQPILNEWKLLSERGDQAMICAQSGISKYKISLALGYGKCDEKTFQAIAKFYSEKKERQQNLTAQVSPY
jgi:hypothetical protein